jgi:hypothetical protein
MTIDEANSTAPLGEAAPHAIIVAIIALASWKPFVNANVSDRMIATIATMRIAVSVITVCLIALH